MSDTNNTVPATAAIVNVKTDTPNAADFKSNPVAWAKKNNKIVFGNVLDTISDGTVNIRFHAGSEVCGIQVLQDTMDIPSMKQQLTEGGGILEPLLISLRADNVKVRLRGNRRGTAAEEMCADPTTPPELVKAFKEHTPMIILTGLTLAQEQELVEDQTQKPFLRSEIVRHIFTLRKQGWGFERLAMMYWETLGRWSGNARKVAEVREIANVDLKRENVKKWLRGSLDNYLLWGHDLGMWAQKQILLSEMKLDGILPANAEQPYFIATKNPQKRIAALKKAREADGAKYSPLMLVPGTEFEKVAKSFHDEDYGLVTKPKSSIKKMLTRETVVGLRDTYQSNAVRSALNVVLGEEVADMQIRDDFATIQETKANLVEQYLPRLKPEIAAIVRACLINPDPMDFQTLLEANCVEMEQNDATAEVVTEPKEESSEFKLETDEATV